MSKESINKRIARNTVLLYFRTAIVLVVSLYSSRILLQALGVVDFGIYNVVGGIVLLMSFFRTALSKSTSRFIIYELGNKGDAGSLNRVFSAAMSIHIIIAVAVIIVGETIGLLILNYWTDIPEARQTAAFWVFQFSIIVFSLQILTSPYESVVIAHENMSVFAYMSILAAILKLGIVLMIMFCDKDRLIIYALLLVVMDLLILLIYALYDRRKYSFTKFTFVWDKEYSGKMFSFSGWTLLGSSANVATQQGVSLLFNNFVGLVANAALGFANQVNSAIQTFVGSFQKAFNPQIIKLYAQEDLTQMRLLMTRSAKFSFILAYVIAVPLIANMELVLQIWLVEVPQYTVDFCQLILVCSVIDATTGVLNTSISATGKIKGFQIGLSVSFMIDLMFAALLLWLNMPPALVFGSRIVTRGLFNMAIELYYVRKFLDYSLQDYFKDVLSPILYILLVTLPIIMLIYNMFDSWEKLLITCSFSLLSCGMATYFILLKRHERQVVFNAIKQKMKK